MPAAGRGFQGTPSGGGPYATRLFLNHSCRRFEPSFAAWLDSSDRQAIVCTEPVWKLAREWGLSDRAAFLEQGPVGVLAR
jgi:hypothetical protein